MLKSLTIFIACICILFTGFTSTFAEEKKVKQVEAKEVMKEKPKVSFSFHGDVNYRFRGDIEANIDAAGESLRKQVDHQHRYAWNLSAGINVSDNLLFGARISNPMGYLTDDVGFDPIQNFGVGLNLGLLTVSEIYFQWNASIVTLAGGKIPVPGNTVLDLAANEGNFPLGYLNATTTWKELMNGAQLGVDLGLMLYKDKSTSLAFNTLYSIAVSSYNTTRGNGRGNAKDALKNDELRFVFSLPLSVLDQKLSFNPVMQLRTNIDRSDDGEEGNHSLAGGLDIAVNAIKQVGFTVGFAAGGFKNDCHEGELGHVDVAPLGILLNVGITALPGYGTINTEFKFSNAQDRELIPDPINYGQIYWAIQYDMPIKGLTITPRMSATHAFNNIKDDDRVDNMLLPELILSAEF